MKKIYIEPQTEISYSLEDDIVCASEVGGVRDDNDAHKQGEESRTTENEDWD